MTKMEVDLRKVYAFLGSADGLNWVLRWDQTPFMDSLAKGSDIKKFLEEKGKFESVASHEWATLLMWNLLRRLAPNLNKLVDSLEIYERMTMHDIGEVESGDHPLAIKINTNLSEGKDIEEKSYANQIGLLPESLKYDFKDWFLEFDYEENNNISLEVLVCRWIDNLQGDQFALYFGSNFSEHSEIIGKIIKKRSVYRARVLMDKLTEMDEVLAANEVKEIISAHVSIIREKGIEVDLTEFNL